MASVSGITTCLSTWRRWITTSWRTSVSKTWRMILCGTAVAASRTWQDWERAEWELRWQQLPLLTDYTDLNKESVVKSKGFWQWCIAFRVTGFLDFVQQVQWLWPALTKRPNREDISLPSPEDGSRSSFRNVIFQLFRIPIILREGRVYPPVIVFFPTSENTEHSPKKSDIGSRD
jgi:hypothetical protein